MTSRLLPATWVVLAAVVAGLLFTPVFGLPALLAPLGVLAAVVLVVAVLASRRAGLVPWRPLLLPAAGLLAVVETTLRPTTAGGLPTGETLSALASGVSQSWQLALQSTWPARPEPAVLLFVPLLVLLAAVLGIEFLLRSTRPLVALLPSLAVLVLSQFYAALSGWAAVLAALAFAVTAGALLVTTGDGPGAGGRGGRRPAFSSSIVAVAVAAGCAVAAGVLLPTPQARYSLKDEQLAPLAQVQVANPMDEIAYRLAHPDRPVFEVRGGAGVDRWPVVVLDQFDGVNWSPGARYRRLGAELRPSPAVTVPVVARTARIESLGLGGPWLPSQTWPAGVREIEPTVEPLVEPLVEEQQGTLLVPEHHQVRGYTLTWWAPRIPAGPLYGAAIDPDAPGGLSGVGTVPAGIAELAEQAVNGTRPTFQAALALERFLRENYRLATGQNLPTGHSWPQLAHFLLDGKRGTSEQFAAAYVALARVRGIPARLVVGYRAPAADESGTQVVRNGDVLAWPEVAVEGVGWVPLDPTGTTTSGASADTELAAATARARAQLPAPQDLLDPPVAPAGQATDGGSRVSGRVPWAALLGVSLAAALLVVLGVPVGKAVRTWRRRRRAGVAAVIGAWEEARDLLRAHGVAVTPGMTVRDLAFAAARIVDRDTVDGLLSLGRTVDVALWSGSAPEEGRAAREAWAAVRQVRRGLTRRGLRARLRAVLEPWTLLRGAT